MPTRTSVTGSELFIVDNSDQEWKVIRYLHDWCQISKSIDIATGYFEIGSLLALNGEWQKVDKIRILMGDEVTQRTKNAFEKGLQKVTGRLDDSVLKRWAALTGLEASARHGLPTGLTPEDIFHYAYAVFHGPGYRTRYAEFLKIDFPRLPLTSSLDLFQALGKLGGELVALHLMESEKLNKPITKYVGHTPSSEVEKVTYSDEAVWIDKAKSQGFHGVPEEVWNFHIGGYQVCYKWLKDRKGRSLSADDIQHYQKIVVALHETIRIMAEIDKVIDQHGGWPGAFQTNESSVSTDNS